MLQILCKMLVTTSLLMISGCAINLAPTIAENNTYVEDGVAGKVTKNVKVPVKQKGTSKSVTTDIGGWNVQPPAHWQAVRRRLLRNEYMVNELAKKLPVEVVEQIQKEANKLQPTED